MSDLKEILDNSKNICFFGGAGVSTESGIPDFRGAKGLYNQAYGSLSPEKIISHSFFLKNPDLFYRFYKEKMIYPNATPNAAHYALAKLEQSGSLTTVITQNIDGLHQAAGSKRVLELHGSVHRNACMQCGKKFPLSYILSAEGVPRCDACGGIIKPDVVLYEEPLDQEAIWQAVEAIQAADTLIIGGTSLSVYPAAGLIQYFQGSHLVIINKTSTPADRKASLVINGSLAETLSQAVLQ